MYDERCFQHVFPFKRGSRRDVWTEGACNLSKSQEDNSIKHIEWTNQLSHDFFLNKCSCITLSVMGQDGENAGNGSS